MANKKIMIVDDDKDFLEELRETLTWSGYDSVAVSDAESVLDQVGSVNPDLILLDLKMPGKTGFQVAAELRRASAEKKIPIVAMSGFFKDDSALLMRLCGIKRYLKKPFNPLDVISEIERSFKENNQQSQGKLRRLFHVLKRD